MGDFGAMAWRTAALTPLSRTIRDVVASDVARYGTGDPVRMHPVRGGAGRTIDSTQPLGAVGDLARGLGMPVPVNRDVADIRQARRERLARIRQAQESYSR